MGIVFRSEEDVKIKGLLPFLSDRGYSQDCMAFEVGIPVQEGRKKKTIFADVVVYATSEKDAPIIVCETKPPTETLDRKAKEQAISYARLLPRIAPIVLVTNGLQTQVYQSLNKNRLPELPPRKKLDAGLVEFVISEDLQEILRREAKHELFIIDDVKAFKNILRACHNTIRNNEGLDPTAAFDEMSKLMFCKLYEEKENPKQNRFRASIYDSSLKDLKVNVVRKILDEVKGSEEYADLFDADTEINLSDRTIRRIVELFEDYDLSLTAFDVKGEAFEYFLGDTFTGGLGEFFTPRNVVEFMVDAIDPKIGEKVVDPFCGTGGFLIYAFDVISEKIRLQEFSNEEKSRWRYELSNRSLCGTDWKSRTSQACKMNMMVHGDGSAGIFMHHGLTDVKGIIEEGVFDVCTTNPPFGSFETDPEILKAYTLGKGKNSQVRVILALERSIALVKPRGKVAIVVIEGVLSNPSTDYVREYLRQHTWIKGIVSLNKETFEGYGSRAKTSILFLEKKQMPDDGKQDPVFMAIAANTGYAPNGDQIPGNVLPDILMDYRTFIQRGKVLGQHPQSWVVEIEDRLDAKFYWRGIETKTVDLENVGRSISIQLAGITEEFDQLAKDLATAFDDLSFEEWKVGELLEEVKDRRELKSDESYRILGVRWWGKGAFIKEEKLGREIKAKTLFRVQSNWIVYNRLFAFRGSFAILEEEHDGCYASSEFPTFKTREGVEMPGLVKEYIVHCMNSPQYLATIEAQSTGSTKVSRNRFNQKRFLGLKIRIPTTEDGLALINSLLSRASDLRRRQEELLGLVQDLRDGILSMLPLPDKSSAGSL